MKKFMNFKSAEWHYFLEQYDLKYGQEKMPFKLFTDITSCILTLIGTGVLLVIFGNAIKQLLPDKYSNVYLIIFGVTFFLIFLKIVNLYLKQIVSFIIKIYLTHKGRSKHITDELVEKFKFEIEKLHFNRLLIIQSTFRFLDKYLSDYNMYEKNSYYLDTYEYISEIYLTIDELMRLIGVLTDKHNDDGGKIEKIKFKKFFYYYSNNIENNGQDKSRINLYIFLTILNNLEIAMRNIQEEMNQNALYIDIKSKLKTIQRYKKALEVFFNEEEDIKINGFF